MKDKQVYILCTRPLDQSLLYKAAQHHIVIDVVPFIKTEMSTDDETHRKILAIADAYKTVVFSSVNAVESVSHHLQLRQPSWKIFCVGKQTVNLAREKFPVSTLAGEADYAAELSRIIINDKSVEDVAFFCGNLRRDDLPNLLQANNVRVQEVTVYQTILTPQKCSRIYNGVMFFSPSAVDSFFSVNTVTPATRIFAIGNTTATAVEQYTSNAVITSHQPGKQQLTDLVIEHFHQLNRTDERIKE